MKSSKILVIALFLVFAGNLSAQNHSNTNDLRISERIEREVSPEAAASIIQRCHKKQLQLNRVKVAKKQFPPVKREAHELRKVQSVQK